MKTTTTKELENCIWQTTRKQGTFCCFEVTIGWFGKERVDYMTYNTEGEWRCYEIKASKADFYSKASKSFLGHYNYFVLTDKVYEQVKDDIPDDIGVYVYATLKKKAKRRALAVDETVLINSMIRSLSRYADDYYQCGTPSIVEQYKRDNNKLQQDLRNAIRRSRDCELELRARQRAERKGVPFDEEEFERNVLGINLHTRKDMPNEN